MIHPIIIDPLGKTQRNSANARQTRLLRHALNQINSFSLQPQRYIMNNADFDDIVRWGKE